jgi:hypothetical protein
MFLKSIALGVCLPACLALFALAPAADGPFWQDPDPVPPRPACKVSGQAPGGPSLDRPSKVLDKRIVFTANQSFLSRIYVLHMDGTEDKCFEYVNYRFVDLEVVDGELFASEAFAPRVYKVDIEDGSLDVIVDDWSLYYFYGLAFDGTYFYVDEWNFRRYTKNGAYAGYTSFDDDVFGSAWDGTHLWTLGDDNIVKCWDISAWPDLVEVTANHFEPPSPDCRGLYHDGKFFWSAESIDDTLGMIFRFDRQGQVKQQWVAPAWNGWGAAVISIRE